MLGVKPRRHDDLPLAYQLFTQHDISGIFSLTIKITNAYATVVTSAFSDVLVTAPATFAYASWGS